MPDDFTSRLKPAEPSGPSTLQNERDGSNIEVQELAQHLLSRNGYLERQERVLKPILEEKLLSKRQQLHLSRPDRYKLGLARAKLLRRMAVRLNWSTEDHAMAEYLVDEMSPYYLHTSMFLTTMREQASDEQQKHWMPLIEDWKIIGSYAQTELGHGSNVRGLELTATYDKTTKEFVLHSPTLTASKWWNGSLGRTATHAIVVAQLILPGGSDGTTSYGPHPFIVEVRNSETHEPHSGIVIGDIGPKYGYASMDNAYMLFDNYRIQHSAFLSRYSKIDPATGAYTKPENAAVVYGSLTDIRTKIVMQSRMILARATTIAVRYLSIRRQFRDRDDKTGQGPEMSVLDYPTVQIRVLPLLATTYALHYTGVAMSDLYASTREEISGGNFSQLADLHALSSALKSCCTMLAADGIETCRRALGGHGFGGGSGLIGLNADYLSKPTVEGDNWMITQQTASYLIKKVDAAMKANGGAPPAPETVEAKLKTYLESKEKAPLDIFYDDAELVEAFERRSAFLAVAAHRAYIIEKQPWNSLLIQLHQLSIAYAQTILVRNFYVAVVEAYSESSSSSAPVPPNAVSVIEACFRLFAFTTLYNNTTEFIRAGAVRLKDSDALLDIIQMLLKQVRPHAVKLVDAWKIPEYLLDSALGRSDGKVYEKLFDMAHRQNPLNRETMNPHYWDEEIVKGQGPPLDLLAKL